MTARVPKCKFCGNSSWEYQTRTSNPIVINVKAVFIALTTVIERRSGVMKCSNCGYPVKI